MFEIGDIIEDSYGELGMIIAQVGVIDRWIVRYFEDDREEGMWGSHLFTIA